MADDLFAGVVKDQGESNRLLTADDIPEDERPEGPRGRTRCAQVGLFLLMGAFLVIGAGIIGGTTYEVIELTHMTIKIDLKSFLLPVIGGTYTMGILMMVTAGVGIVAACTRKKSVLAVFMFFFGILAIITLAAVAATFVLGVGGDNPAKKFVKNEVLDVWNTTLYGTNGSEIVCQWQLALECSGCLRTCDQAVKYPNETLCPEPPPDNTTNPCNLTLSNSYKEACVPKIIDKTNQYIVYIGVGSGLVVALLLIVLCLACGLCCSRHESKSKEVYAINDYHSDAYL